MKNIKRHGILLLMLVVFLACSQMVNAQDLEQGVVSGTVTDLFNNPVPNVVVNSDNGKDGTLSNFKGEYSLSTASEAGSLIFTADGFQNKKIKLNGSATLDVQLNYDVHRKDEIIELGYSVQKRSELSGSVSTISGEELERSPVANLTQTLAGRLAGLTTQETYSELSRASTNLFVRGLSANRQNGPLVIIDGIINAYNSSQSLDYISPNEIESITILKDASTQALYGIQGANGLIVVKTKRGIKGGLRIKTRFDQSFQQASTKPSLYSASDYAQLRNQAAFNDGLGANYLFSESQLAGYKSGTDKQLYPNNNWYAQFIKDVALMQRASANLTGGNDKVQFFSNINFMHQGGLFKTSQEKYDPNSNNIWVNYRTNVDMNLNKYLKAFIRLSGNIKRERTPGAGNSSVYASVFQLPPTLYGPLTPDVIGADGEVQLGGKVITTERVADPTFGKLNRTGYYRHTVTNITSQFGLDLDMGFLTKGLNLKGILAYQTNSVGSLGTNQNYERYVRTNDVNKLDFVKKGAQNDTPLSYSKSHQYYYHLTYNTSLNYDRNFGRHHISGLAYMFYQNLTKADNSSPGLLPYNRISTGAEIAYAFDNRYMVKADMGYSGSEQYARNKRFIATPAISAAWAISNEAFLVNSEWLSNLKIRASYGKTANDQSSLARFAYLDNVTVDRSGVIASLQYNVNENQKGNPFIQAEVATKQNFGLDVGLFNSVTLSMDVFNEKMSNMVVSAFATIPLFQGIPLRNYPKTNSGSFKNQGYELTANYFKQVNKDFGVNLGFMYSYAKNTIINSNEVKRTDDYAFAKVEEGYSFGQAFGYLVDYSNGNGFFNTQAEIDSKNLAYGFGTSRVGDLIYQDLNKDGNIDERDKAPIGTGVIPRSVYSLSGGVNYRSFDFNILFQGIGNYDALENGTGVFETDFDGVFSSLHSNAWTTERYQNGEKISYPALSLAKSVNHESSDFFKYNKSYLRVKNIELGYTLPSNLSKLISSENIRLVLSGQNIFTWDKMKTKDFGPEGSGYSSFPVYKVYNVGVSVIF